MAMKIENDRISDVARAIKESHYPDHVDSDFTQEARSFVAAFNACFAIVEEGPMVVLKAHGNNGIGAVPLPGALVGMRVAAVINNIAPNKFIDVTDRFEDVISEADQIQQKDHTNLAAAELQFSLRPPLELPDQKTTAPTPVGEFVLHFKLAPPWVRPGMFVFGSGIAPNAKVAEFASGATAGPPNTVTLSTPVVVPGVADGQVVHFAHTDSVHHAGFFGFGREPAPVLPPAKEPTIVPAMTPVDRPEPVVREL